MNGELLICTDLDRTLIPNGPQAESPGARTLFEKLVNLPSIRLAYVTGRDRRLVEQGIAEYSLPLPDYVIGDVGTTIYRLESPQRWLRQHYWEDQIATDWNGLENREIRTLLADLDLLELQEESRQNRNKLSYDVPLDSDQQKLDCIIKDRLTAQGVRANLIWSVDEILGVNLLDILPESASKLHAIVCLMQQSGFDLENTLFCGDSGNDIEALVSPIAAVLVNNSQPEVKQRALRLSADAGLSDRLYLAHGDYPGMNGNYSAGILEGARHFYPALTGRVLSEPQPVERV